MLMQPSQALLLLCHLDNDLVIIIIYIYCVVHMTYIPYLGTFDFSRYPSSVALARNISNTIPIYMGVSPIKF